MAQNRIVVFIAGMVTGLVLLACLTTNPEPSTAQAVVHKTGCPGIVDPHIPVGGGGIRLMNRVELMP